MLFSAASQPSGAPVKSNSFNFPEALAEKYRPKKISEFIGVTRAKKALAKLAAAPYPSSWLFYGPPGTGKTSMALAFAAAINGEIHHVPSQKCNVEELDKVVKQCWYAPHGGTLHVVIVDEADKMSFPAQLAFLSKLDATGFPPATIFIFTCNSTSGLEPRFLSRTRQIEFSLADFAADIEAFLRKIWKLEKGEGKPNFARIVASSQNNLRDALMKLETDLLAGPEEYKEEVKVAKPVLAPVLVKRVHRRETCSVGRAAALKAWETRRANARKAA
jgi:replication-associated recombination protein RarA